MKTGTTELEIRYLGPKGDGIHVGSRGPVYVDRALPGDKLKARVSKDEQGVSRGEIVRVLQASPHRRAAPCPHYEQCGGCTLQHASLPFYRGWKEDVVREALAKNGLRPMRWLPTRFIGEHHRRRATFAAVKRGGRVVLGYYRRRTKEITEIQDCLVADPGLLALREEAKTAVARFLRDDKPVDVFLQKVGNASEIVVDGKRVNRGVLRARFGKLEVELPPFAFLQPTAPGERALVDAVMAALPPKGNFADLFSGCGTFTGPMLERGSVDAYEAELSAVKALARAGEGHALHVYRRDLFRNPLRREDINRYDAVVFDPPRPGCREQVEAMASARTSLLVGVSCNPATFARDARILCDGGYRLASLQIVDQFTWSHHVEMVGTFTKPKRPRR